MAATPVLAINIASLRPFLVATQRPVRGNLGGSLLSDDASSLLGDVVITPGMPVEVFIETVHRTALNYFLGPISDMVARSFREQ